MLPAGRRLRRREEFTAVVRGGRRAGRGCVVVHAAVSEAAGLADDSAVAKAGFVIPRTVGIAVTRNKVRRRLRQLVHDRLGDLPPGTSLVIRALPTAGGRTYGELAENLDAALSAALRDTRGHRRSVERRRGGE